MADEQQWHRLKIFIVVVGGVGVDDRFTASANEQRRQEEEDEPRR